MYYSSTRNNDIKVSSKHAISQGISEDLGLFVPNEFPSFSFDDFKRMSELDYKELATEIFREFLTDFSYESIVECVNKAYTSDKFNGVEPVKYSKFSDTNAEILELWHGPTSAFKDMALQILPHFLTRSFKDTHSDKQAVILTATSGDTGKAALEGFKNVDNTKIMVFYPENGVSNMQKLQMRTQDGNNVYVCAVKGNFDDVQTGIKNIFTDKMCIKKLEENGMMFSSANSINWGRLLPQIVYYIHAYCHAIKIGKIKSENDKINIVVPTGNFGNILSAYYAMKMGVRVNRLICASNSNNVLTDFINTGVYDRNREFFMTMSPSMDILISSNLERLLYDLTDGNDKEVSKLMGELSENGKYEVDATVKSRIKELFFGGFCDERNTAETIKETFVNKGYLCDTHTAVAVNVYNQYVKTTEDKDTYTIIASTASPYKFSKDVLLSIDNSLDLSSKNDFDIIELLSKRTNTDIPKPLLSLKNKKAVFNDSCGVDLIRKAVFDSLKIE